MSISVEIWRSASGTAPDDFSLFRTVVDAPPYTALDSPVVSGQLYIYKARRYDSSTGFYSDFSPLLFLVGPYPAEGLIMNNLYANVNPNQVTKIGIGIEPSGVPGQAVKAARLLSLVSFSPGKSGMKRIEREDWRGLPGLIGVVKGEAKYPLKLTVVGTPESFDELLCTYFGAPVTTSVSAPSAPGAPTVTPEGAAGSTSYSYKIVARNPQGDSAESTAGTTSTGNATLSPTNYNQIVWLPVQGATQYVVINSTSGNIVAITQGLTANDTGSNLGTYTAPSAPTGNQQQWVANNSFLTATLSVFYGNGPAGSGSPLNRIYSGVRGDKLALKFEKTSNTPFKLDMDLMALYEVDGFSLSATGLDVATYDTLDPFAEAFAQVSIGGALADCSAFNVNLDLNLGAKGALTGYAGDIAHYKQGSKHKLTATLYWSSDAEKQRFFGQANQAGTYSELQKCLYFPIQMLVANPVNAGGIVNQFSVYCAYAAYDTEGEDIKGRDGAIMQDVEIYPNIDPGSTGTDVVVTSVNSRSNSNIITPGTLITGFNAGGVNPYSN